jgi:hypothetical protein
MIAIKEIEKKHDFSFTFGSASFELYEASGCSEDWSKHVAKVNHTFVVELKPEKAETPESGFVYPESDVLQSAIELYDGLFAYISSFIPASEFYRVDEKIIEECKLKLANMIEHLNDENNYGFIDIPRETNS